MKGEARASPFFMKTRLNSFVEDSSRGLPTPSALLPSVTPMLYCTHDTDRAAAGSKEI